MLRGGAAARAAVSKQKTVLSQHASARFFSDLSKPASPQGFVGSTMGSSGLRTAQLVLEDGSRFTGVSFGHEESCSGEIVFNTNMVGYPESLTDPSYRGQLLVSTYPMVGNYGVPGAGEIDEFGLPKHFESDRIHASAFIASDYSHNYSNWESTRSLSQWLREEKIPGLYGIDTRLLTQKIRDRGSMLAKIEFLPSYCPPGYEEIGFVDVNARNLIAEVSTKDVKVFGEGNPIKILSVDCGIKYNIIRNLVKRGVELHSVPFDYPIHEHMDKFDGLFLSNGPGDPVMAAKTVENLKKVLDNGLDKPLFGICMGNQLTAQAAGAKTYKMRFGNRGSNQPVLNLLTGQCYITPQNHGYAIDTDSLSSDWQPLFVNKNDGTNEGIMHKTKPYFTAQFHPEAKGGPTDTEFLFDDYLNLVKDGKQSVGSLFEPRKVPDTRVHVKKVLVLGSGGLSIGQAGEFDYSGNQAIKSLKEEGIETILMNPNIASVQTNLTGENQADHVYFLPVTPDFVEDVIKAEKPDGLILSMGGQTGLNVGVELYNSGILDKYNVKVLGTSVESIVATEDRGIFSDKLAEINEKVAHSYAVNNIPDAIVAAEKVGYPCMIRSAFALGGLGSGICNDENHLRDMAAKALSSSPQILVEKSMLGWKELEYEVVRDSADNCITVCNMENFDPLGVHTGDSIVIAPSQTLSNHDYHMLRDTAIKVVRHLGIIGECNIQYALNPHSDEYCIIEVNPRLSRSSALASKATGYPLAFVAAKLSLGIQLPDIVNQVTKTTTACFEPSLDYVVTKIPRWDLTKFDKVNRKIASAMKSVGEVMAIGRNWEESFQKALRMTDDSVKGYQAHPARYLVPADEKDLLEELERPTDLRPYAIAHAMGNLGWDIAKVHEHTKIDTWFLGKLKRIHHIDEMLRRHTLDSLNSTLVLQAKKSGFSDKQIAERVGCEELEVRAFRKSLGITPFVKQIDTVAGESPAATNYLYTTYNADSDDIKFDDHGTMVIGSGVYRIGSSVEFDWCSVSAIRTLRKLGKKSVVVNYNPETVSTDYDESDRLYFEELSLERVLDIYEKEGCESAIVSVGGQIPNTLALPLHKYGCKIAGTSPEMIDSAEDRKKFSSACDKFDIDQPEWSELTSQEEAFNFADKVGYPVLVRPSYVLSGAAMNVAYNAGELARNLQVAGEINNDHPVVISKFIENAREIDIDGVADNGEVICHAIAEHVENAGVHSGDATLMLPPQTLSEEVLAKCRETARRIAKAFEITGPFNMQLIASNDGDVKIIETNVRASRSFPFSSKTLGVDFIEAATHVMVGAGRPEGLAEMDVGLDGKRPYPKTYLGVKVPQFSFKRLAGADPKLGVEMASTGEVATYGVTKEEAFMKSMLSTLQWNFPKKKAILVSIQDKLLPDFKESCQKLTDNGYKIYATEKTGNYLESNGIPVTTLKWDENGQSLGVDKAVLSGEIDQVFMFSNNLSERTQTNYEIRRLATDYGVPLITNLQVGAMLADCYSLHAQGKLDLDSKKLVDYYAQEGMTFNKK